MALNLSLLIHSNLRCPPSPLCETPELCLPTSAVSLRSSGNRNNCLPFMTLPTALMSFGPVPKRSHASQLLIPGHLASNPTTLGFSLVTASTSNLVFLDPTLKKGYKNRVSCTKNLCPFVRTQGLGRKNWSLRWPRGWTERRGTGSDRRERRGVRFLLQQSPAPATHTHTLSLTHTLTLLEGDICY